VLLFEFLAEGGILDVAVERDNTIVAVTECRQRLAVRFTRGDGFAECVRKGAQRRLLRRGRRPALIASGSRSAGGMRWFLLGHELRFELVQHGIELLSLLER